MKRIPILTAPTVLCGFGSLVLVIATGCGPESSYDQNANACTPEPEICGDQIDNDCDLLPDCADPDCAGVGACDGTQDGIATCGELDIETGELPLPDGVGELFAGVATIDGFSSGQTLSNANDFTRVCATMEHSWLHDLEISLVCPSGERIILHNITVPNSTGTAGMTFLGEPNDPDNASAPNAIQTDWGAIEPGVGYEYCWTPDATNGTWREYADAHTPGTLPPGDYHAYDDWALLQGCELNGDWTLEIYDRWGSDNGLIFGWNLEFNTDIISDCSVW